MIDSLRILTGCAAIALGFSACATHDSALDAGDTGPSQLDVGASDAPDVTGNDGSDVTASDAYDAAAAVGAPRPIAPLSTSTSTSRRPSFRWALAPGSDGAHVQVCRDRACATIVTEFDASGTSGSPAADLPAGMLFWRLQSRIGTTSIPAMSPTWEVGIGARSATVASTSWGTTLDVNGDGFADLVVGANDANRNTGAAYVYLGSATGLASMRATSLSGPDGPNGYFGWSVASAGDVNGDGFADLVVSAVGANGNAGRVYVYLGSATGLASSWATSLQGLDHAVGSFGASVASAGDVNGDGFADVVVGAYTGLGNAGRAYVYLGSAGGLASTPAVSLAGPDGANGHFGVSVASVGDLNGDGFADLVVGAAGANGNVGAAYLYVGSAAGLGSTPATSLSGLDGAGGVFGLSVASAGDVNGDGFADLVVGAYGALSFAGRAYVYLGSATGLNSMPATSLSEPDGAFAFFGGSVASAGDVNGDGFADLIVGADAANGNVGEAYVYLGSVTGLGSAPATSLSGFNGAGESFGYAVASTGDVNGDGFADLVVTADGANASSGGAYVYLGSATGLAAAPATSLLGPDGAGAGFGHSVASVCDVQGDRFLWPSRMDYVIPGES